MTGSNDKNESKYNNHSDDWDGLCVHIYEAANRVSYS